MDGEQQTQVFGMDEILDTPNMVYPIFVDPDWSTVRTSYVYVDSGYPNTSYWNGQYTDATGHVGYLPAAWAGDGMNHVTRTFYQFNTSPLAGKVILSARMDTVETWASSCTPTPVSAWVTGGVNSGTKWNAQPGFLQKVSTQTVAKGYTGCAQGTVSFDMGSAKSWLTSSPQWTVALRADNESDPLGWKRFTNNPVMRVTYGTAPATPSIWGITGGLWHTHSTTGVKTYVTRFNKPTYTVKASDPDGVNGGTISVTMKIKRVSTGAVVQTGTTPAGSAAAGTMFALGSSVVLTDDKYVLEAQTKDQQGLVSGWMSFNFTVDTTAPPPPVITATSPALQNSTATDPTGVIGETAYTLSVSKGPDAGSKMSYDFDSIIYAVSSTTVDTYPAQGMACNERDGIFVKVCGSPVSITVAGIEQETHVYAWAFDAAGNASTETMSDKKSPAYFKFTVGGSPHPLPASSLPLTLHGGAELVDINAPGGSPSPRTCPAVVDPEGDPSGVAKALRFSGAGDYASTAAGAINTAQSFSIGLWVCNTGAQETSLARNIVTQIAGTGSPGAAIRLTPQGKAEIAQWTGPSSTGLSSSPAISDMETKRWYYIAAVSDKINGQLRISVSVDGMVNTWVTTEGATSGRTALANQPVRLGYSGLAGDGQFVGEIFNPAMTNGVLTPDQFTTLRQQVNLTGDIRK